MKYLVSYSYETSSGTQGVGNATINSNSILEFIDDIPSIQDTIMLSDNYSNVVIHNYILMDKNDDD